MITDRRLWLTKNGNVVEDGHPSAHELLVGVGGYIPDDRARQLGLLPPAATFSLDVPSTYTRIEDADRTSLAAKGILIENTAGLDDPVQIAAFVVLTDGRTVPVDPSSVIYKDRNGSYSIGTVIANHKTHLAQGDRADRSPTVPDAASPTGLRVETIPSGETERRNEGKPPEIVENPAAAGDSATPKNVPAKAAKIDPYAGLDGLTDASRADLKAAGFADAEAVKSAALDALVALPSIGPDLAARLTGKTGNPATPNTPTTPGVNPNVDPAATVTGPIDADTKRDAEAAKANGGVDPNGGKDPFEGVPGITGELGAALKAAGILDAKAVGEASDDDLLKVPGLGRARLATIRGN